MLKNKNINQEIQKIIEFIKSNIDKNQKAVIGVSGGLDSDVVARLATLAIGKDRVKLYTIIQDDMEKSHFKNAKSLAEDLGINLTIINLKKIPYKIINQLQQSDKEESFNKNSFLDIGRTKVALRTVINSIYQDRGYKIIGTSNRSEIELGFFLPFGDGLAHIKPIAHLYKSDIFKIAKELKTKKQVLKQKPSAGLWKDENDLEDISYWIYNQAPIQIERDFSDNELKEVQKIYRELTIKKIDKALFMISNKEKISKIVLKSKLSKDTLKRLKRLVKNSKKLKLQPIGVFVDR
jgi:NAD+ synthase